MERPLNVIEGRQELCECAGWLIVGILPQFFGWRKVEWWCYCGESLMVCWHIARMWGTWGMWGRWFQSYLSDRSFRVIYCNQTSSTVYI